MLMTSGGMLVRIPLDDVRDIGRNTQGVRLIRVNEGDQLIGAELVSPEEVKESDGTKGEAESDTEPSAETDSGSDD